MPRVVTIIKFGIAAAIVVVLANSGQLQLQSIVDLFTNAATVIGLIVLQVSILMLGVFRWWLVIGSLEGRRLPYGQLLAFNWIGQFFGCVAPSTVATDATRFTFVAANGMASRSNTLMSLLVDRSAGIIGTITLAAALTGAYALRSIAISRVAGPVAVAIVALIVVLAVLAPRDPRLFKGLRDALGAFRKARVSGMVAILAAMAAMALKILSIWLIARVILPQPPSVALVFSVAPMGLLAEALPLTPGGLGTAHLAFEYLFRQAAIAGGAALFNAYFIVRLMVSLVGGVVWLSRRAPKRPLANHAITVLADAK